jgi:hypothetical protein
MLNRTQIEINRVILQRFKMSFMRSIFKVLFYLKRDKQKKEWQSAFILPDYR